MPFHSQWNGIPSGLYGGQPQLPTQGGDDKKADFLRLLYLTVYLRDFYERNNIE
ncbi:MAG: hypothetical protein ACI4TW_08265 [Prevotella sp.]